MRTARQDPMRFLYLERQFCSLCRANGKPGVRVVHLGEGRPTLRAWRAAALRHLKAEHPKAYAEVTR